MVNFFNGGFVKHNTEEIYN